MSATPSSPTATSEFQAAELPIVNIAAYKFVSLDRLDERRVGLRDLCREVRLKGTILLTPEGLNLFIAGSREGIDRLLAELRSDPLLADLEVKESYSRDQPFERMLVKIKEEIIAFGVAGVDPRNYTSKKIPARKLKEWLDTGEEVLLLDTRNDYEVRVGTFENALPIGVDHFRDFPEAVEGLPPELRERPIVMFCTGGIRCEKAGPFMEQAGFRNVYQLEGGILKYFEECGGDHYQGECFVFDKRVALGPDLQETATTQCYACLAPLTPEDQASDKYDPPHHCPHCYLTEAEQQQRLLDQRHRRLRVVTTPLPGSVPYDNARPLNVSQQFDNFQLLDFLVARHPHYGREYWEQECQTGRLRKGGRALTGTEVLRGGDQLAHLHPATTEPEVSVDIRILHEDDALVVVDKPAPLPMHPSGRFHRNTLQWILNEVYHPLKLNPAHRLDANTTGIAVFCKKRAVSRLVQPQFEQGTVQKSYLALVQGTVAWEELTCAAPIARDAGTCGGRGVDLEQGLPAETRFELLQVRADGTTLIRAIPLTGRTNQIRIHLWHLGLPIVGDPLYLPGQQWGERQTLNVGEQMCLHASELTFTHPETSTPITFHAPTPDWAADVPSGTGLNNLSSEHHC